MRKHKGIDWLVVDSRGRVVSRNSSYVDACISEYSNRGAIPREPMSIEAELNEYESDLLIKYCDKHIETLDFLARLCFVLGALVVAMALVAI